MHGKILKAFDRCPDQPSAVPTHVDALLRVFEGGAVTGGTSRSYLYALAQQLKANNDTTLSTNRLAAMLCHTDPNPLDVISW